MDLSALEEYGFVAGQTATYTRGADSLQVSLYRMKDPSAAYGEYSYLRTPEMPRADLSEHSSLTHDRALILTGNLVLEIRGNDLSKYRSDIAALVEPLSRHAEQGLYPTLWQRLPVTGIIERTDHYVLGPTVLRKFFANLDGDLIGFSQGAEAELARYRYKSRELTLLIIDYPTPQTAQKKLSELEQKRIVNVSVANGAKPLFAKRSLTLLAIVSGAESQTEANLLLNQVHSGTEVTWNEPSFSFTEPGIGTMIVGAIMGTGIICAFALIAGLAFGGFRLAVKRLLPNRVFDRSSQMQILQLGLSTKPINAEDFYGFTKLRGK
ncbi:MAG TPA: DUF6599 family protein [Candidatus Limnocylindrales bacterium]|nr:DUF6599 family protein [Candidatus Limnocylindrales bacterium]